MTKIYKTQEELNSDIRNGLLKYNGNIIIEFDDAVINANITAKNITAKNINAVDINAKNINARDINAVDINAVDINAVDINAVDITAKNIDARDINVRSINAQDITYYAVCFAYETFTCNSIKGKRDNHKHFCLDNEIIIRGE